MQIEYNGTWFKANVKHFDQWFDPNHFDYSYFPLLAKYCMVHFDKWWNYRIQAFINWKHYLKRHCMDHIDIWYDEAHFTESKADLQWQHLKTKMESHL